MNTGRSKLIVHRYETDISFQIMFVLCDVGVGIFILKMEQKVLLFFK